MTTEALYELFSRYPSVQTDTRKIRQGDLFFALKGPNFNGNQFAQEALDRGAAYAVIDEAAYQAGQDRCIVVPDVLTALQQLALHHRKQFNIPFIAITGSNGKTTSKELITAVLRQQYITYATEGNLNNHIGVPLTLLRIQKDAAIAVIEMGANHLGEIASYCAIALPTHGVITNCGKAHLEGFGSIEGVRKGKGELYDFLRLHNGTILRNTDLDYLEDMSQGIGTQITYGSAPSADYSGEALSEDLLLQVNVNSKGYETTIHSQLVGAYNFPNIMLAVATGAHFGIDIDRIKAAVEQYSPDNSRSQLLKAGDNDVILDAYNANPTSMKAAIANFADNSRHSHKILWLGAMKEMGKEEAIEHEALVRYIDQWSWQQVILVGKEFEAVAGRHTWFPDALAANAYIQQHQPQQALILIKGSRGSKMEQLLSALPASGQQQT